MALIVPYRLYIAHKHITLWHYVIDPLILAVSAKTWASLSAADRAMLQEAAQAVMGEQKKEAERGSTIPRLSCMSCVRFMEWTSFTLQPTTSKRFGIKPDLCTPSGLARLALIWSGRPRKLSRVANENRADEVIG